MVADNAPADTLFASYPRLLIDGQEASELMQALHWLEVELALNQPARCRLRLNNWGRSQEGDPGYLFSDGESLAHGQLLEVFAGAGAGAPRLFQGQITRLEGIYPADTPPEIEVTAYDGLARLGQVRRSRSFAQLTDAEVVEFMASEYGLDTDIQLSQSLPRHSSLVQIEQSDLQFLQRRIAALDALLWVDDDTLHLQSWLSAGGEIVTLQYGRQLLAARLAADLAGQAGRLDLPGWSPQIKQPLLGEADQASLSGETGGLESGPQILENIFGEQNDQILHHQPADFSQAQALAAVAFRQQSRGFVSGELVALLQPGLRPGGRAALSGLGAHFDGSYRVERVLHRFDGQSFHSHLQVSRSGQSQTKSGKPGASRPDPAHVKRQPPSIIRPGSSGETKDTPKQQGGTKHDTD